MALQVRNTKHPKASSGWVALTEEAPWPVGEDLFEIRDTALAAAAATAESATISLPVKALPILASHGIEEADGTVTAGTGDLYKVWRGASHATANTHPIPANGDTNGSQSQPRAGAGAGDTNKYGDVYYPGRDFYIRFIALAGTKTTVELRVNVQLAAPYWP